MSADHIFSFGVGTSCGDPGALIHDVQGAGRPPRPAAQTVTIEGVVVGDYQGTGPFSGYYVQEEDADADATRDLGGHLRVQHLDRRSASGDRVRVAGTRRRVQRPDPDRPVTQRARLRDRQRSVTPAIVTLPVAADRRLGAVRGHARRPRPAS